MRKLHLFVGTIGLVFVAVQSVGQTPAPTPARTMTVEEYEPRSTLVVPEHLVTRAKYPFIDVHTHYNAVMPRAQLDQLVAELDRITCELRLTSAAALATGWRQA